MSHILIADDDQFLAGLCARAFEQAGYETTVAHDGPETVERLVDQKPDLVLLDLLLPGIDGIGILKFIRSRSELEGLPVFIVSNSTYFSGIVQSAWNEGATNFIRKGEFSPKGLVEEIRKSVPPKEDPRASLAEPEEGKDPAESPKAAKKAKSSRKDGEKTGKTALIADDDRTIHSVLVYFLGRAGYRIESVFNGLQALEVARQEAPDVLILDVTMPIKGGFETLMEWNQDPELKEIPVIMLTASQDEENESRAKGAGATHYLTKPFSPESLVRLADEVTSGA
ncbi:MAG: response regulator [Akkermansiaceae bacterium]|nr:response regulator [Akkermansiaceae bacterium]